MGKPFCWIRGYERVDIHLVALQKLGLYEQILDDATLTVIADLNQEHIQVLRRDLDAGDSHS